MSTLHQMQIGAESYLNARRSYNIERPISLKHGAKRIMKELRFGVIGCGGIAQMMHIPHLTEHEQFKLVALADLDPAVLQAVGDRYNVAGRYTNWRELLARDDIDAVGIFHGGSHRDTVIG